MYDSGTCISFPVSYRTMASAYTSVFNILNKLLNENFKIIY